MAHVWFCNLFGLSVCLFICLFGRLQKVLNVHQKLVQLKPKSMQTGEIVGVLEGYLDHLYNQSDNLGNPAIDEHDELDETDSIRMQLNTSTSSRRESGIIWYEVRGITGDDDNQMDDLATPYHYLFDNGIMHTLIQCWKIGVRNENRILIAKTIEILTKFVTRNEFRAPFLANGCYNLIKSTLNIDCPIFKSPKKENYSHSNLAPPKSNEELEKETENDLKHCGHVVTVLELIHELAQSENEVLIAQCAHNQMDKVRLFFLFVCLFILFIVLLVVAFYFFVNLSVRLVVFFFVLFRSLSFFLGKTLTTFCHAKKT